MGCITLMFVPMRLLIQCSLRNFILWSNLFRKIDSCVLPKSNWHVCSTKQCEQNELLSAIRCANLSSVCSVYLCILPLTRLSVRSGDVRRSVLLQPIHSHCILCDNYCAISSESHTQIYANFTKHMNKTQAAAVIPEQTLFWESLVVF